jgi:hypothetical protein
MNQDQFIAASQAGLDALLAERFHLGLADLTRQTLQSTGPALPVELVQALAELAETQDRLKSDPAADPARLASYAFRCGQVHEQVRAWLRIEMEVENARIGLDSVEPSPLQAGQADLMARFVETRDQMFRQVADFTLKALLISLGLLTVGLILGLI